MSISLAASETALPAPRRSPVGFDWATITVGDFLMGSDREQDELAFDDETPQHTLYLPEYRIARVPVTVGPPTTHTERINDGGGGFVHPCEPFVDGPTRFHAASVLRATRPGFSRRPSITRW